MAELTLIVAATRSMGIGFHGGLPWKGLRKEMQYFARVTQRASPLSPGRNAVIMGRKTWDSIPPSYRPLKNRLNIIVTRSAEHNPDDAEESAFVRVASVEAAIRYAQSRSVSRIFIIGGATIYKAALDVAAAKKRVLLTRIDEDFECDVFFPLDLTGKVPGWTRRTTAELREWTGEDVQDEQEEGGVHYQYQMWETE